MINSNHNAVKGYDKYLCFAFLRHFILCLNDVLFYVFAVTAPLLSSNLELNSILAEEFDNLGCSDFLESRCVYSYFRHSA